MSRDNRINTNRYSSGTVRRSGSGSHAPGKSRKKKRHSNTPMLIAAGVVIIFIIAAVFFFRSRSGGASNAENGQTEAASASEQIVRHNAVIDLSSVVKYGSGIEADSLLRVQGMTPDEISRSITERYKWSLTLVNEDAAVGTVVKPLADINETTEAATFGDAENPDTALEGAEAESISDISVRDSIEIPDLIAERIPALIDEIMAEDALLSADPTLESEAETTKKSLFGGKKETEAEEPDASSEPERVYSLVLDDIDEELEDIVSYAANMWYVEPLGGSIGSYDREKDSFIMENSRTGFIIDKDKLLSDLKGAVASYEYTARIEASGTRLSAEDASNVSGPYTTLATYTTKTTSNAVRNKNIQLACEKLNGTIVRPGEEFSFNSTVGERTREAGYGEAAAYSNGEVVQEVGGGVCQVSTTLYNAVLEAGLKITARHSHTFKPTYVTPGQDATISWGGPDFRFANLPGRPEYSYGNTYAIGIRASYSDQVVTVSIYGRPVLLEGYSFSLSSQQIKTIEVVRKLIEPGSDKQPSTGTQGSVWETRLIIKKGDEIISNAVDHNAYYSGHIEYYTEESSSESESGEAGDITDVPEGPGGPGSDGTGNGGVIVDNDVTGGPGSESTASSNAPVSSGGAASGSSSGSYAPGESISGEGSDHNGGPSGVTSPGSSSSGSSQSDGPSGSAPGGQSPVSGAASGPSGGSMTSPSISAGGPGT